jgi:addiction module RelE/StbE family toxin
MRVKWQRLALKKLNDEAEYLAKEAPQAAREFARALLTGIETLRKRPQLGRPGRVPGTRELALSRFPYLAVYRVREDALEILRVFHASRKWPRKSRGGDAS